MCDLDVARGGLVAGPPAGSMSCGHNQVSIKGQGQSVRSILVKRRGDDGPD
jgi:hypothetical protein